MRKQTLGQFLKRIREDKKLTLREVESVSGISNAYLSQLEGDKIKQPSPVWLHKLGELYKVSYATLLGLAGYPIPGQSSNREVQSGVSARLGPLSPGEEDALVEYLDFLRSRRNRRRSGR